MPGLVALYDVQPGNGSDLFLQPGPSMVDTRQVYNQWLVQVKIYNAASHTHTH